jgi:hypothetical protein
MHSAVKARRLQFMFRKITEARDLVDKKPKMKISSNSAEL